MGIGKYFKKYNDSYRYSNSKAVRIIYLILHIMVIVTAVRCLLTQNYEGVLLCILTLVLFLAPAFLEDKLDLTIPPLFQIIIFFFIFSAEILGEVNHYYVKIPGWDTILHTMNGFLCAAIGFSLVYLLNRGSKNVNLSPFYLTLVAFCFSMTIGVVWEFFEFIMDQIFLLDMQKDFIVTQFGSVTLDPAQAQNVIKVKDIVSTVITTASGETYTISTGYLDIGIIDSMKDLLVNLAGAVVFSIIGYITLKKSKTSKVAENFMIKPNQHEENGEENKGNDAENSGNNVENKENPADQKENGGNKNKTGTEGNKNKKKRRNRHK